MDRKHVVVVGNGMVGHRFCERLHGLDDAGSFAITVFGDEPRPAYDRVRLTSYFDTRDPETLSLGGASWYQERGIDLQTGQRIANLDRRRKRLTTERGQTVDYDVLVLATGSAPFIPPLYGIELPGVFAYRTIEDLEAIAAHARGATSCAVIGGGLLGLEAARAVQQCGVETHVVELAPRLMPR